MRYAKKRFYSWSEQIAYSVGLIASDGCLERDGRHIDLTSVDAQQLFNFRKALGTDFRISQKRNGVGQISHRIQFSDVAYYDFLLGVGLTPAKSKSISALEIPREFYPDFLRGVFDGDGSAFGYRDERWPASYMFYLSFASASPPFLKFLRQTNSRLCGVTEGSVRRCSGAHALVYAKQDSRRLQRYMYYDHDVLCLRRKRLNVERLMDEDRNQSCMHTRARVVKLVNTQP